jgi:hypothetical protein
MLDADRALVIFNEDSTEPDWRLRRAKIVVFDLKTGKRREFGVPVMNNEPELLAEVPLADRAVRVAYTIKGDCDPATSDYSQPGQPDGVLGNTPNQFSVCFITIPPAEVKVPASSGEPK